MKTLRQPPRRPGFIRVFAGHDVSIKRACLKRERAKHVALLKSAREHAEFEQWRVVLEEMANKDWSRSRSGEPGTWERKIQTWQASWRQRGKDRARVRCGWQRSLGFKTATWPEAIRRMRQEAGRAQDRGSRDAWTRWCESVRRNNDRRAMTNGRSDKCEGITKHAGGAGLQMRLDWQDTDAGDGDA